MHPCVQTPGWGKVAHCSSVENMIKEDKLGDPNKRDLTLHEVDRLLSED